MMDRLRRALYAGDRGKRIDALERLARELSAAHSDPLIEWETIRHLVGQLRAEYGRRRARDRLLEWLETVDVAFRSTAREKFPDLFVTDAELERPRIEYVPRRAVALGSGAEHPLLGQSIDRYDFAELMDEDELQTLYLGLVYEDNEHAGAANPVVIRATRNGDDGGHRFLKSTEALSGAAGYSKTDPVLLRGESSFIAHHTQADANLQRVLRGSVVRHTMEQKLAFFCELCIVVARIHDHRSMGAHGDLRPANILLDERSLTRPELLPGRGLRHGETNFLHKILATWLDNRELSAATADVYSLGKILKLLVGDLGPKSVIGAIIGRIVERADEAPAQYSIGQLAADADALSSLSYTLGKTALDRYTIRKYRGSGRSGHVFYATVQRGGGAESLAIKLMKTDVMTEDVKERFMAEGLLNIAQDHLVLVKARFVEEGIYWEEMELLAGCSLEGVTADTKATLQWGVQLALASMHLHLLGVSRFDLKPSNILLDQDKAALKIIDYRITPTKHQNPIRTFYTPEYSAPETRDGKAGSARSDVYSLGKVLSEIWRPENGDPSHRVTALTEFIRQMLADSEDARPDMAAVYFELRRINESTPPAAVHVEKRSPWPFFALGAVGLLTIAACIVAITIHGRANTSAKAADAARMHAQKTISELQTTLGNTRNVVGTLTTELATSNSKVARYRRDELERKKIANVLLTECRAMLDLREFDAKCAGHAVQELLDKRAALVSKRLDALKNTMTLSRADARSLLTLDPNDVRALTLWFSQASAPRDCLDIKTFTNNVLGLTPRAPDLASVARQKRLECTPVPLQAPLLAEWYEATLDQAQIRKLLALDVDFGVSEMEKVKATKEVKCGTLLSATGADRAQIASYQRRFECGGLEYLEVSAAEDVCVSVCDDAPGCGCDTASKITGRFDVLKKYKATANWNVDGKKIVTEAIPVALESGQMNFLNVREIRISALGRGEGDFEISAASFQSISCPITAASRTCSAGFIVHQDEARVVVEWHAAGPNDVFLGWDPAVCAATGPCNISLKATRSKLAATFAKKPLVKVNSNILIDGVACATPSGCVVEIGRRQLTVPPQTGKQAEWNGCTPDAAGGCVLDARADGMFEVSVEWRDASQ